jgi:tetratricopeptide (TPR) repeat protein
MGVVYKARQRSLNRLVALKMIHTGIQDKPELLARFKIEAEAVARLHDPHIVQIHELGDFEGSPFISLELLEGGSLRERLTGNPQPARQAAELVATLAEAMQAAHRADIVHRDLKPANILFTTDGVPKVTDFGLAKRVEKGSELTHTGAVLGTPNYMAPEQARGRVHEIGPATDIYSLGAILYEMLTGRPPFKGTTVMETVRQVAEEEPVSPSRLQPRVPRDLVTICLKCLAKEPHKRYPTAKALAEDLHRYLAGEPIRARRTSVVGRGLKWARRKPAAALLLMVTMAALMGLTGAGLWYQRREGERIAELRTKNTDALFKAQDNLEQKEWGRAEAALSTVFAAIGDQPRLGDLRARSIILLEQARRGLEEQKAWREDRARFDRFRQLRDEALLLDTDFTGLDLPSNVGATRQTARDALEIFAEKEPRAGWALAPLPSSFSVQEQAEVTEGCCELILVWAEAMARPLSHTEEAGRQASQALQILDLTAKLPPSARPTRAYHLRRAEFLTIEGDTAGAGGERAQADRLQPATAFDHFLYGHELYKRGRWTEAIDQFEATLGKESGHFWARCLLAICELQTQRPAEARIILSACIQLRPSFAWLHLLRGFANSQVGVLDLKAAPRQAVGETDPIPAGTAARFAEAEADYRQAMQLFRPSDDDLRYALLVNRGSMRLQRRELTDALADLQAAVQLEPRLFHAYTHLAEAFRQQGLWDRAIDQLDRAIDLRPERQYLASLYRSRAGMQLERKDLAAALRDREEAIRYEPSEGLKVGDHAIRGELLHRMERHQEALDACDVALRIAQGATDKSQLALVSAGLTEAHRWRAGALLSLERYDQVIEACDGYLAKGRPMAIFHEIRGLARERRKDLAGAIEDFTQAMILQPHQSAVHTHRGWAYLVSGAAQLALDDFEKAIQDDTSNGDAYYGRGSALVALGKYKEAVVEAEDALHHGEPTPRMLYVAARIYAQAADLAITKASRRTLGPPRISFQYTARAQGLLRRALEKLPAEQRAAFWRDVIQEDPTLRVILRHADFAEPGRSFPATEPMKSPRSRPLAALSLPGPWR